MNSQSTPTSGVAPTTTTPMASSVHPAAGARAPCSPYSTCRRYSGR